MNKTTKIILFLIFGISILYSFTSQVPPMVDAKKYDNFAVHLSQGGNYDVGYLKFAGPGYPLFLAGIYSIFGHSYVLIWIIQAVLHTLTAYFVLRISEKLFQNWPHQKSISILAMSLYGFYPDLIQSTAFLMTETLYLFLITVATYLCLKLLDQPNQYLKIFFPIVLGTTILVRPVALIFFLFALLFYGFQKKYQEAIFLLVITILIIAPFSYLFSQKTGTFTLLSNAGGFDLWLGNNPQANGEIIAIPESTAIFKGLTDTEANKKGIQEVLKFIKEKPLNWLDLQITKTSKYFSLIRPYGFWFYLSKLQQLLIVIPSAIFLFIIFGFGLSGLWVSLRQMPTKINKLFALLALSAPASIIPIIVEPRFRFQIYPFLTIYAAYVIILLIKNFSLVPKIEKKIVAFVFLILISNAAIDVYREKDLVISRLKFYRNNESQDFRIDSK
ncbi:MAG: hypothetical protein A3I24_02920 [Candidatus Harrisonbacteria bacterium RIFCSPLOWO2_02_FULL_41_13b]|uniref:Uncharacterized protein n=1 Tax=Candidatus Harrisonbacteria bacterium RIFCSPLOWO2_02_FULL_41_13b TaxID=1798409 RepID=A0A1G1ZTG1_9BACT|nr:MAG: hypothetical protein A3J53_01950 [Candidatus Harrisonbacteria bacterium RIFCSPHIGHO2_02_FULL_40_20]OGY67107.1 MAG: hypothetical protein A3I24_02920 [Candidatus Harrisonbacteria bacterium RIFCSPLOWO2_02_FULL_41_13b]